ncbi:MAG: hypothetical protein WAV90_00420 [Gordonia amarae]
MTTPETEPVTELTPESRGVWWVHTTGGTVHVWDMEELTVLRAPGVDSRSGEMRFDGDPQPLVAVLMWPRVGECSLIAFWHPEEDDRIVTRISSVITRITRPGA